MIGVNNGKIRAWFTAASLLLAACQALAAADYTREKRWADEVEPGVIVGEPVYLTQKNRHAFLSIYTEHSEAKLGVIVVHGMGLHPDWGMIGTLRTRLNDYGYSTLSIQMPVLAADASYTAYPALFPEAAERLQLAVNFLKQKGYRHIAIVSHSNGSRMTRTYMTGNPPGVITWVALSLTQGDTYAGIKAPVFDLYGEQDLPHVLAAVAARRASLANPASKQAVIKGADHFFTGREEAMLGAVKDYLDRALIARLNLSRLDDGGRAYCPGWE